MNNKIKIGISALVGAVIGGAITYYTMSRMMNWMDLVTTSARIGWMHSVLDEYEKKGTEKVIDLLREALEAQVKLANFKCEYFKCREKPDKYSFEIERIDRAIEYLKKHSYNKTPQSDAATLRR